MPRSRMRTKLQSGLAGVRCLVNRLGRLEVFRHQELVEQRLRIGRNGEHGVMRGCEKLLVAHVGEELKQQVIEAAGVEQADGLEVQAKLEPGKNLDDLLQCPNATGERD